MEQNGVLKFIKIDLSFCLLTLLPIFVIISQFADWVSIVATVVTLAGLCLIKDEQKFNVIGFILPMAVALKFMGYHIFFAVIIAFFALYMLIKALVVKKITINIASFVSFIAIIVFMFLPIGPIDYFKFGFSGLLILMVLYAIVFYAFRNEVSLESFATYSFAGLIASAAAFIILVLARQTSITQYGRLGLLFENVNHLSEYCAAMIGLLSVCFFTSKKRIRFLVFLLIALIVGLLTKSKSFYILAAVVAIIDFIYFAVTEPKNKKYNIIVPVVSALIAIIIIASVAGFLVRMKGTAFNLNSLTTFRVDIWRNAIKQFTHSALTIIFGAGMGAHVETYPNLLTSHNIYLEYLSKLGIVGVLLLSLLIVFLIKAARKTRKVKPRVIYYLPMLVLLLYGLVESMILNFAMDIMLPLSIVLPLILPIKTSQNQENFALPNEARVKGVDGANGESKHELKNDDGDK